MGVPLKRNSKILKTFELKTLQLFKLPSKAMKLLYDILILQIWRGRRCVWWDSIAVVIWVQLFSTTLLIHHCLVLTVWCCLAAVTTKCLHLVRSFHGIQTVQVIYCTSNVVTCGHWYSNGTIVKKESVYSFSRLLWDDNSRSYKCF